MNCTTPLDDIGVELGFVCSRWNTKDEIDQSTREDDNRESSIGEYLELEPTSTIRGAVHVFKSNYSVYPFGNAFA